MQKHQDVDIDIFYWNGTKGDGRELKKKMKTSLWQSSNSNEETELSMLSSFMLPAQ